MVTRARKKSVIILNQELEQALKGYVPVFGDDRDISLLRKLESLHVKLGTVDNQVLRGTKRSDGRNGLTAMMKEIQTMEKSLIDEIKKRNMDF